MNIIHLIFVTATLFTLADSLKIIKAIAYSAYNKKLQFENLPCHSLRSSYFLLYGNSQHLKGKETNQFTDNAVTALTTIANTVLNIGSTLLFDSHTSDSLSTCVSRIEISHEKNHENSHENIGNKNSGTAHINKAPILASTAPYHVAYIVDGNGRWAERNNQTRLEGHNRGVVWWYSAICVIVLNVFGILC